MCRVFPLATNPVRVKAPSVSRRPSTNSVFNTAIASFNNTYFSCVYDESSGRQLKEEDAASQGVGLDSNSAAEIKTLAIEDKWFADLRIAIEGEVERLTQRLAGRVQRKSRGTLEEDEGGVGMSADTVTIPRWSPQGVLPPINSATPTSTDRSPYCVSLIDFVLRFGNTGPRRRIVAGFLDFRSALHEIGVDNGFQWVDGSFLEDIERGENRSPRDLDLVTFFRLPQGRTQRTLRDAAPNIFDHAYCKENFRVDAYFQPLNDGLPESLVARSAYWYSVWSHRRNGYWKGYLQLDLSNTDDEIARADIALSIDEGAR